MNGLDSVLEQIRELSAAVDGHVHKLRQATDKRFDAVDQRLDSVDKRLNSVDSRLDSVDRQLTLIVGLLKLR